MLNVSLTEFHRQRFKPIFEHIERACEQIGIEFFLVGAVARDISMALHGLEVPRVTRDLDLAVLIPEEDDYQHLKEILLAQGDFAEVRTMPFTLKYAGETDVDLLPFGGMEVNSHVSLNRGEAVVRLAVNGFAEVYKHGTYKVTLDDQYTFRVCDLPGMVLLKLIAYDDRPEHRVKDLTDIAFIIKNYEEIIGDELFDTHFDLLEGEISLELISARILGRHIRPMLDASPELRERVIDILNRAIADGPEGAVVRYIYTAQYRGFPLEHTFNLLLQLRAGLDDTLTTVTTD